MIMNLLPCANILPAAFTEDISTYEILCELLEKISEVGNKTDGLLQSANQYTDTSIQNVKTDVEQMINVVNQSMSDLAEKLEKEMSDLNSDVNKYVNQQIEDVHTLIRQQINSMYLYIDNQTKALQLTLQSMNEAQQIYIISEIAKVYEWLENNAKMIPIMSPIYHQLQPIQKVIDDMYNLVNIGGITCGEYDALGLTCGEYDSKDLTCYQYDTNARKYLVPDMRFILYFPETGLAENYKKVIYWLTEFHRTNSLTALDYDNLELTAEEYDSKELTAHQYDWDSKNILDEEVT